MAEQYTNTAMVKYLLEHGAVQGSCKYFKIGWQLPPGLAAQFEDEVMFMRNRQEADHELMSMI